MAKQSQIKPYGICCTGLCITSLHPVFARKPGISILCDQFCRDRRQRVFSKERNQGAGPVLFCVLRKWPFRRRHVRQIALHRGLKRHPFGWTTLNKQTAHHLILGSTRPVVSVFFETKCFNGGGPSCLADDRFPGA